MITEEEIKINFGKNVKELRNSRNITQEKLAEFLDLQTQTITAIENGKTFISCEVLMKLCNFFEIEPFLLFLPKININSENYTDYNSKIMALLPKFSTEKLNEIYNILLILR